MMKRTFYAMAIVVFLAGSMATANSGEHSKAQESKRPVAEETVISTEELSREDSEKLATELQKLDEAIAGANGVGEVASE